MGPYGTPLKTKQNKQKKKKKSNATPFTVVKVLQWTLLQAPGGGPYESWLGFSKIFSSGFCHFLFGFVNI